MSHTLTGSDGSGRPPMSPRISLMPTFAFAVSGLIAFAITGLLGYASRPGPDFLSLDFSSPLAFFDTLFRKPWLLFGWLCALIFMLQAAILRQQPLTEKRRRQQQWTYAVTGLCIILVALIDLAGARILNAISNFIDLIGQIFQNTHGILFRFIASPWLYTFVNFALIAWLAIRAARRAIRLRAERAKLRAEYETASPSEKPVVEQRLDQLPEMHELIIGDLLVSSAIVLALSFVVRYELLKYVIPQPVPRGDLPVFDACSVALPGRCPPSLAPLYTDTLSFYDLIIALFGLVAGVALAAVFAQAMAPAEVREDPQTAVADHGLVQDPTADPIAPNPDSDLPPMQTHSFGRLAQSAADQLLAILVRPFVPVGSEQDGEPSPYDPLAVLRSLAWPLLILGGTAAAGGCARETAFVLHHAPFEAFTLPTIGTYNPARLMHEAVAAVMALLALACIIGSARVLTRDRRVALAGTAYLKENGVITLILFCAYSFALWLFQTLLFALFRPASDPLRRLQAFNPGFLTIASLVLLLWFGLPNLWKRFGVNTLRPKSG
jgi:hypothetical protein